MKQNNLPTNFTEKSGYHGAGHAATIATTICFKTCMRAVTASNVYMKRILTKNGTMENSLENS